MKIIDNKRHYTITDIAKELNMAVPSVWWQIYRSKVIPAPTIRVGRRDYYCEEEFRRLASRS